MLRVETPLLWIAITAVTENITYVFQRRALEKERIFSIQHIYFDEKQGVISTSTPHLP